MHDISRSDTGEMSPFSLTNSINEDCRSLQAKYDITARFYDILDYPWQEIGYGQDYHYPLTISFIKPCYTLVLYPFQPKE